MPALRSVTLRQIMTATGVAKSTASGWRQGRHIPHHMHWAALAALVGAKGP
jgi:transcriptional regulator with XRE-family HTH domain